MRDIYKGDWMMNKQIIISVGREFGSGGREIAHKLAEHYNIPVYDKNLLKEVLDEKNVYRSDLDKYDESKKRIGIYRTVRGMDSSPESNIAEMQFDFLRKKAEKGESFVVVGRCGETILKEYPAMISFFVLGDKQEKLDRIIKIYNLSSDAAEKKMKEMDFKRKKYHNSYCDGKWGDSRNYDVSINSSKLGTDDTLKILIDYIETRKCK